jgi:hypothetical protein
MPCKFLVALTALLLTGAATVSARAQTPEPETAAPSESNAGPSHRLTGAAVVFNLVDSDGDGEIDLEEASTLFETIFTTLDADNSGKLSKDEINAALRRMNAGGPEGRGHDYHRDGHRHHR